MKILTNKNYMELQKTLKFYEERGEKLENIFYKVSKENEKIKKEYETLKLQEEKELTIISGLEREIKALQGAKGGLTKKINKLKTQIELKEEQFNEIVEELNKTKIQLDASLTDKYLRIKVPRGKMPMGEKMAIKSHEKQDKIIQKMQERIEKGV